MKRKTYRWCAVPQCTNTSIATPNKVFIDVPRKADIRRKWLDLARRKCDGMSVTSPIYFCEDHFDLLNDMENYMRYHIMGTVDKVMLKRGCLPTKFQCQSNRKRSLPFTVTSRPAAIKRQRLALVQEALRDSTLMSDTKEVNTTLSPRLSNMKHKEEKFDENSYCMLLRKSKEKLLCDFCDKTFNSRYANIIHNAHHIVIPLLKQEVHQCKKCLFYFPSHDDLISHLVTKHNVANKHITKVKSNIQIACTGQVKSTHQPTTSEELKAYSNLKVLEIVDITDDDDEQICSDGSTSNLSVKKLSNLQASDNKETFVSPNDIPNLTVKRRKCENLQTDIEKKTLNNDQQNHYLERYVKHMKPKEDIVTSPWSVAVDKKVSAYENQCDSMLDIKREEYILPDVYYDVKISPNLQVNQSTVVPVTNLQPHLNFKKIIDQNYENDDGILLGHEMNIDRSKPSLSKSIHYSELTVQSNLSCKYCQNDNVFPNRYTLVLHETSHLSIMNRQPNFCILCNLYFNHKDYERHMKYNHPNIIKKRNNLKSCLICGFKHYNYKKHLKQYHFNMFLWEDDIFFNQYKKQEITYGKIIFKCVNPISNLNSDIARVCKCYTTSWKNDVKYKIIGTLKKKGARLKCHECGKEVIIIDFVEKFIERFKFEGDFKKMKKKKSNEQRLKNIQMRLKMINRLSRLYEYFLFPIPIS